MTPAPLLAAPAIILAHTTLSLLAFATGTTVLVATKGTRFHRAYGWVFVATMLAVAATSFFITGLTPGHYSPIHVLSIVTLVTLPLAVWRRRRGDIRAHAIAMSLNYAGLVSAGAFALLPPRLLSKVLLGN